jgi:hypothetical protein
MLLNEFLKAHRKLDEQQKQIEGLANKLQKMSDQLGVEQVGARVGANKREQRRNRSENAIR